MSDSPNPRINSAQTSAVVCSRHTMNIRGILKLFEAISRAKIGFLNFGAKFKFCRIFTKIADISPLRSKSKNPLRGKKFASIFSSLQKGVYSYLKYRAHKVSQKFGESNFKNYLR